MRLKSIELFGFKSFAKKSSLEFNSSITAVVGPNGSGKSNVVEAFRFVLGEQSIKSMRGKRGEDLIWNGSVNTPRAGRAVVRVVLDNKTSEKKSSERAFNVDFPEVIIERVVNRDGANEYLLNGSSVRLRDIIELLAGAHIGSSGHHIISQGEADKILNASAKDRKAIIEDALGLKLYQYKREESSKKLEKTFENIAQVQALRKEIAPHLKFLRKQVDKIEKAEGMRDELLLLSKKYFADEDLYIKSSKEAISSEKKPLESRLSTLRNELAEAKGILAKADKPGDKELKILNLETEIAGTRAMRDGLVRELGKIEGSLLAEERMEKKEKELAHPGGDRMIRFEEIEELGKIVESETEGAGRIINSKSLQEIIARVRQSVFEFIRSRRQSANPDQLAEIHNRIEELRKEKSKTEKELSQIQEKEKALQDNYSHLKKEIDEDKDSSREAEKAVFRIMAEENELISTKRILESREERIKLEEEEFKRELEEVAHLIGTEVLRFREEGKSPLPAHGQASGHSRPTAISLLPRHEQEERKREIQKLKIRLEDAGLSGTDEVLKEYKETSDRDEFLAREILDLETSAAALENLIKELEERLYKEFTQGLEHINKEFGTLFADMFGGGEARLVLTKESVEVEEGEVPEKPVEGLDIAVNLPRKKIRGLVMLSGGERALTSIALIFAVSQVNPPPFIILDETDAALDEANSRRYGDMVERLSKHSQLILITHNRETMGRAGTIYGVTMDGGGVSKLLSIAFEEATQIAK